MFLMLVVMFIFFEREQKRRDKGEKERFREFVLAIKADKVEDYTLSLPADNDVPLQQQEEDELVDLDQVDPETLLKAIKNENN